MASAEHGSHQLVRSTDPQPDGTLAKDLASEDILEILRLPDGTIKYQHSIGRPIVNEKGDFVEFVGTAIDVTEQAQARIELEKAFEEIKQRTEAARRSKRALRDVVNTVPAHVWSTSPDGQVDFVNDRWLPFTGLALAEAVGGRWGGVLDRDA